MRFTLLSFNVIKLWKKRIIYGIRKGIEKNGCPSRAFGTVKSADVEKILIKVVLSSGAGFVFDPVGVAYHFLELKSLNHSIFLVCSLVFNNQAITLGACTVQQRLNYILKS